jgi:hypothetical protein
MLPIRQAEVTASAPIEGAAEAKNIVLKRCEAAASHITGETSAK